MKLQNTKPRKILIPIILMMGFVPMIVHIFTYNSGLSQFDWFPADSDANADFFFAWKMIALIIIGVVMVGILLYQNIKKKHTLQFDSSFYFLLFYALFVIMSAIISPYRRWAFTGSYELFESVFVLFSYMILVCYIYNYVQEEKQVHIVLRWSGMGALIVTLIAVFQSFGWDFFKSTLGKMLITNPDSWNNLDSLGFTMSKGTAYTSLYNPNYLSFYFGMLIPLLACLIIACKKIWQRVILVIAEVLALMSLWGSRSDSGWLALIIGAGITALILLSRTKKTGIAGVVLVVTGLIGLVVVVSQTSAGQRLYNAIVGTFHMEDAYALKDFKTGDDYISMQINDKELHLSYDMDESGQINIVATDADGKKLATTRIDESNMIDCLDDASYGGITVQPVSLDDMLGVSVTLDDFTWNFVWKDNHYYFMNPAGKLVDYRRPAHSTLFRDDAMNGRGHIWNDTIPLLGKHIFIGSGANTFLFSYPQTDYIYQYYAQHGSVLDVKTHNWYLQQWVETGLLGTLALLIFLGIYIVRSASIYRKADLKKSVTWIGIGLFSAVLVYLAAATTNDSNVCTAPVFWGMLGLGMAVNRMIAEKEGLFPAAAATGEPAETAESADRAKDQSTDPQPVSGKKSGKKKSRKERKKST